MRPSMIALGPREYWVQTVERNSLRQPHPGDRASAGSPAALAPASSPSAAKNPPTTPPLVGFGSTHPSAMLCLVMTPILSTTQRERAAQASQYRVARSVEHDINSYAEAIQEHRRPDGLADS